MESNHLPYRSERTVGYGKVLVFAPHPDDEVFGCGGAIMRHVEAGDPVHVVVLTDGAHEPDAAGDPRAYAATRERESLEAAAILGYGRPEFWRLPDRGLAYGEELVRRLLAAISEHTPQIVYAPAIGEVHPDHRALALSAVEAVRRSEYAPRLAMYEVGVPLAPNLLLDISDLSERKHAAMRCFASQLARQPYDQHIAALNRYRTYTLGPEVSAAEAYRVESAGDLRRDPLALHETEFLRQHATAPMPRGDTPLVSVIIRSVGRPELRQALDSVALQTYPHIEVVLVNAAGAGHPEVGEWCGRFPLRMCGEGRPLIRTRAANLGLERAAGKYLVFLDDDDWFLPDHIANLVERIGRSPPARLVYAGVECVRAAADGRWEQVHLFNEPFDAIRLLCENYIPMHAALFERSLVDDGVRFDETLEVYEDWDFWIQIAKKSPFVHSDRVSAVYRISEQGGFGINGDPQTIARSLARLFAKWRPLWDERQVASLMERAKAGYHGERRAVEIERQKELLDTLTGEQQALLQNNADLESRLREFEGTLLDSQTELRKARDELRAVWNSASMRLTAPLRALKRISPSGRASGADRPPRSARPRLRLVTGARRVLGRLARALYRLLPLSDGTKLRLKSAVFARLGFLLVDMAAYQQWRSYQPGGPARDRYDGVTSPELVSVRARDAAAAAAGLDFAAPAQPVVSIVIPVYNQLPFTVACLVALCRHPVRAGFEVIVVDDGSTDDTAAVLSSVANLRLVRAGRNGGYIRACNLGAGEARGKYLLFLNNDTQVQSGWLDALLETFERVPETGLAGAKLVFPDGRLQEAGCMLRSDGSAEVVGLHDNPARPEYNFMREVDYCSGACLMIERELFERLGGFDGSESRAYYEDADLAMRVRRAGRKVMYQPACVVMHHLSVTTDEHGTGKADDLARAREVFVRRWRVQLAERAKVRLIAFFLPQFHPVPENDQWWGRGFTEWTNVTKARPNFVGHYQPQLPADLGFYDLRVPEVREEQARLAREYGVHGFCYYYYWFSGRRLLYRPLEEMVKSGRPDFPFCVCWANENWTRRWDGQDSEILISQGYTVEDDHRFIEDLVAVLQDRRYIRIDGRPMLIVYRADLLPDPLRTTGIWREHCRRIGIGEIFLAYVQSFMTEVDPHECGFDAAIEFPPHGMGAVAHDALPLTNSRFSGVVYDYVESVRRIQDRALPPYLFFRTAMPAWDNTARRQNDGHIFLRSTPEQYEQWLRTIVRQTRRLRAGDQRVVFVNAWNEWAEGNHLEPDRRFGHRYLEATRRALG